jgi:hypothetical protein
VPDNGFRENHVANDGTRGERRLQRRYPVALELEYKVMEGGEVTGTGAGRTGNIGSGGVFFQTEDKLAEGPNVELSIRWPSVPGGEPSIELRMSGRVLRSDTRGTALQMCRYHFQKPGNSGTAAEPPFGNAMIQ